MMTSCPVCQAQSVWYCQVDGYKYFECSGCGIIHIDNATLNAIDAGRRIVRYDPGYWEEETRAAEERSGGTGIVRMAEAIFFCQRPVKNVIDIGTGTGRLLDHLDRLLPQNAKSIWGVELFPPPAHQRTNSPRYIEGTIQTLAPIMFDAGLCMEVIEHLTPKMVSSMLEELARHSNDGACYVFNTGLASFVKLEDSGYLDPTTRGHIVSWTVDAINHLGNNFSLTASALQGRNWAFLVEKTLSPKRVEDRLYNPLPENMHFLSDGDQGMSLLAVAASEAARGYYHQHLAAERTAWALSLDQELKDQKELQAKRNWFG